MVTKVKPTDEYIVSAKAAPARPNRTQVVSLLIVFITAILSSIFWYQARYDDTFQDFALNWRANWICAPFPSHSASFRKLIEIDAPVRSAYIAITADDFYQIRVNGVVPTAHTYNGFIPTLLSRQTVYNETGFGRRDLIGHMYDIRKLLLPGKNVIAVTAESDEQQPKLLLQCYYADSRPHLVVSDSSWRCSPLDEIHNGLTSDLPQFNDAGWVAASVIPGATNIPVDDDSTLLGTPIQGDFITSPSPNSGSTVMFRRLLYCPGTVKQGWLRVNWWCPYDLSVDGKVIGSSSQPDRYNASMVNKTVEWDRLRRVMGGTSSPYPSGSSSNNVDVYLGRDIMRRGNNLIEVTIHKESLLGKSAFASVNVNAYFNFDDGSHQFIATNNQWSVFDNSSRQWVPATEAYSASDTYSNTNREAIRNWIIPGEWTLGRIVRNFIFLLLLFYVVGIAVDRFRNRSARTHLFGTHVPAPAGWIYLAPCVVLVSAFLLQIVFEESQQSTFVLEPHYGAISLILAGAVFIAVLLLTLLNVDRRHLESEPIQRLTNRWFESLSSIVARYGFAIALSAIVLISSLYCFHNLYSSDYLPDEYVSMLAARGILRHGIPIYEASHIVYTRSALYHYLLALFMFVGGSTTNPYATRTPAGLWQIATVILVYFFGRRVKNRWAGLCAAALVGLSPFMIFYAREARFYTQFTFFSTLCFYYLWESIREPEVAKHRIAVGVTYMLAYLSQELMITVLPAIAIVIFLAGQIKFWMRGTGLVVLLSVFSGMVIEYIIYEKLCMTPLSYIDSDSIMLFAFHFDILDALPSMLLVSNERSQIVVGGIFIAGLLYFVFRKSPASRTLTTEESDQWRWWNFLYLVTTITLVTITVFTPRPTPRYGINCLPLVALTSACVIDGFIIRSNRWIKAMMPFSLVGKFTSIFVAIGLVAITFAGYRPMRVWFNTNRAENMSSTSMARYVKNHMLPGDKIIFCSPEFAMMEIGHCDYFWRTTPSSIYAYVDSYGVLRERDSNAVAINSIDKLRDVVTQNSRVWLVVPNWNATIPQVSPQDSEMYRMSNFVTANFQLVDEGCDDNVYLWDKSRSHYSDGYRASGGDSLNFSLQ